MFEDDPQDLEDVIERQSERIHALVEILVEQGFPLDDLVEFLASV